MAFAALTDDGVLHVCVNNKNGNMSAVESFAECKNSDEQIDLALAGSGLTFTLRETIHAVPQGSTFVNVCTPPIRLPRRANNRSRDGYYGGMDMSMFCPDRVRDSPLLGYISGNGYEVLVDRWTQIPIHGPTS